MFSDAIHFANVGAAFEQRLIDGLLFGQAQTLGGQRQQGGAATRYEAQNQIVLGQTLGQLQNFFCGCQTRRIRHRMRSLYHFQTGRHTLRTLGGVAVTRHHHARQRGMLGPKRLNGMGHGTRSLACAKYQRSASGHLGQIVWRVVQRQGPLDCCLK